MGPTFPRPDGVLNLYTQPESAREADIRDALCFGEVADKSTGGVKDKKGEYTAFHISEPRRDPSSVQVDLGTKSLLGPNDHSWQSALDTGASSILQFQPTTFPSPTTQQGADRRSNSPASYGTPESQQSQDTGTTYTDPKVSPQLSGFVAESLARNEVPANKDATLRRSSREQEKDGIIWEMDSVKYYALSATERKRVRNRVSARISRAKQKRDSLLLSGQSEQRPKSHPCLAERLDHNKSREEVLQAMITHAKLVSEDADRMRGEVVTCKYLQKSTQRTVTKLTVSDKQVTILRKTL
jgi:hypothetical protein